MTQPVDIDYEPEGLPPGSVNIFAPVAVAGSGPGEHWDRPLRMAWPEVTEEEN